MTKGLWMARAKELCPDLVILPYDYDSIRRISAQVCEIVQQFTHVIQVGSCDELVCDLSQYFADGSFLDVCRKIR